MDTLVLYMQTVAREWAAAVYFTFKESLGMEHQECLSLKYAVNVCI
jgi:hypothetical protein